MGKSDQIHGLTIKKTVIITAILLSAFLLFAPHHAKAALGDDWELSSFNTDIEVRTDGSLFVTETIVADFSRDAHHGIYRIIPIRYRDKYGQSYKLRYSLNSVTDQNENNWWYEKWTEGDYLSIKIGDPDRTYKEPVTYIITYEIQRAMSFQFPDHDELYWNATGEEWPIPILNATATVTYPDEITSAQVDAICYTGGYKSTGQDCTHEIKGNTVFYKSTVPFNAYEGLTIVVGFPKGIITPLTFQQQLIWTLQDNWGYFIPVVTFFLLLYLWWSRGKDPQTNRDTVMPIYTPPKGLTPGEAGTLIDERADMHDLSATIIDMAVRGYLKINETKKKTWIGENTEYDFELLKEFESDSTLKDHEKKTMTAIFGSGKSRKLTDLQNKFYMDLPKIKDSIYESLVHDKFFPSSPEKVRKTYDGIGIGCLVFAFFTFGFFIDYSLAIPVGIGLSGVIILIFSHFMPIKTKKGVEMYYQVLGLEMFIRTAETDRLKWKEKENIFEQLLPYAMAFRLADKWSKSFEGLYKNPPKWYSSTDPNFINSFNAGYLVGRLNNLSNSMNSTFSSAPRSSGSGGSWSGGSGFGGGGFSGGGFGGGGGRGW